jgi:hypothetical protein
MYACVAKASSSSVQLFFNSLSYSLKSALYLKLFCGAFPELATPFPHLKFSPKMAQRHNVVHLSRLGLSLIRCSWSEY